MKTKQSSIARVGLVASLLLTACLGGCGGGGVSTPAASVSSAEGSWNGTTNTSRTITGIVLGDGTYYLLYTVANDPTTLAGFVQGTGSSSSGSYTSSNLKDYNLEGLGVNSGSIATTYTAKQSLNGTISYSGGTQTTFTSSYDAVYANTPAALSVVAGTYPGTVFAPNASNQTFSIAVSASGVISSTGNGCTVSGTIAPRSAGNAYDVSMTYTGASCSLAGTYTGLADYSTALSKLMIAAPNSTRSNALIFIGVETVTPPTGANTLIGTVRGPVGAQVVLQNNGTDNTSVTVASSVSSQYNETSFAFATVPASGAAYAVTLSSTPTNQTCSVYKGATGTIPVTATSVRVGCEYTYDLFSRSTDSSVVSYNSYNQDAAIGGNATTGEGRYVAFVSSMSNLASSNTNAHRQVFWRDRQTGQTLLVSANSSGVEGNGDSVAPAISADGQKVAFESAATNLAGSDANGAVNDVFIWSAAAPTAGVQLVSKSTAGVQGDAASTEPTLSGDGSVVAFSTYATNLTASVINTGNSNVVRRDLTSNTTTLVSGTGVGGNFGSSRPSISEDGTRVAFWSYASNLVAGDANSLWDIFVYDTTSGLTRVSLANGGGERSSGDGISSIVSPTISGNGRYVAYSSWATNVVSGDTGGFKDVFVVDTQTSGASLSVVRASVTTAGVQANGNSPIGQLDRLGMSYDGSWVAFNTNATNLGTTAGNVVMHNISTGETRAVSTGTSQNTSVDISRTGAYVSFGTGTVGLDSRFSSSGLIARFTGVGRAWWWID